MKVDEQSKALDLPWKFWDEDTAPERIARPAQHEFR
jgi:hypothetical protein